MTGGTMVTATNRAIDENQIRTMRGDLTNALRAKDANGVIAHYATNAVLFDPEPPLQHIAKDAATGKQNLERWFSSFQGSIGYEVRDLTLAIGDDVAFCHSLDHLSGTKNDGENVDVWLRETLCLQRIDGRWKITHEHQSVPFYMDGSYKAAIDLKP
jgi:PhnB protein